MNGHLQRIMTGPVMIRCTRSVYSRCFLLIKSLVMDNDNSTEVIEETLSEASVNRRKQQEEVRAQLFLKGPIPLPWLIRARTCGLLSVVVGLLLWFVAGCRRRSTDLTVSSKQFQAFDLSRQTFSKGLKKLEDAGLVSVIRQPGKKPRITILE